MESMMTSEDTAVFAQIAVVIVLSLAGLTGIGVFIHSYLQRAKRLVTKQVSAGGDDDRMRRLEQAVDAIAVEVERISEGQRFLTKLQTAKPAERVLGE
jgi:hypothetical protein